MPAEVTYPPLDVPKPVAEGVWIVDSGPLGAMGLKLPVRMTIVRLGSGGLWLHSPTRVDPGLESTLQEIGPIRHLVAPNVGHWKFVKDWQDACPDAVTWAAPRLKSRFQPRMSGLRVDRELAETPPGEWADEIDQLIVPGGGGYREAAFLHRPSRTLILTDLVANLEPDKLPFATRAFAGANGMLAPDGKAPLYLRASVMLRRREAAAAARRLLGWAPERVIFAHGRWFSRDGTAALARSLRWLTG